MCVKYERRCDALLQLREEALMEWAVAETYEQVRAAWSRLGGRVTLHRHGTDHFRRMALVRWSR